MPPVGSDLFLSWTWRTCLVLSVVALAIALALALKRWIEERGRLRKLAKKTEVERLAQALIASSIELVPANIPPLGRGGEGALFSVALDILRVARGRDADRMMALLDVWKLRPYVEKLLAGGRRSRRIRALTLLSHYRDADSLALLLRHLEDPGVYVQLAALRGVAERGDVAHLPQVVRALGRSRQTNVPMLADILRRFGAPAVPALADLAESPSAVLEVRIAAVVAMGNIGSLDAFGPLRATAGSPVAALRIRALESLSRLGDPRAEGVVITALGDPEAPVRAAAARAAGLLGLVGALPFLAEALEDESWEVRYRAADSLYALGAPGIAVLRATAAGGTPGGEMSAELLAEKEGVPG